jgi:ATP-dependent DNA helicase RecQ
MMRQCGECDNCRHPKSGSEENVVARAQAISLDERFATIAPTVNVIVGKLTPQLMMFRHEGL